jgi:hypothetical protein
MLRPGPTVGTYLAWAKLVRDTGIAVAIHENVAQFPASAIQDMFGGSHCLTCLTVCAKDIGFARQCRRSRVFDVILMRSAVQLIGDIGLTYNTLKRHFLEVNADAPCAAFMTASAQEVEEMLQIWRSERQGRCSCGALSPKRCKCSFRDLLSAPQQERLAQPATLYVSWFMWLRILYRARIDTGRATC